MTMCLFFVIVFSNAHNCTQNNIYMDYMKRPNIFFQDQVFDHMVAFKCLHEGLQPFIGAGLHKRGVWSSGDD
jgi:hypothetical protein